MKTLEINLNEDYRIKIEKGKKFNDSIFKEVYVTAIKNVIEIVKQSDENGKSVYDDFNNIIAFTGERGKGKSSSMISFMEALINKGHEDHKDFFKNDFEELNNKKISGIGLIDPSLFKGEESLFEIILAKMFQEFQSKIKDNDFKIQDEDRRSIITHFSDVFENLQVINSDRKDLYKLESIEALSKLATGSNLRQCFKSLVEVYLDKFLKGNNYLIIAIDDFDLNVSGAYEMLEDIRQFLIQDKIILLIACKVEQLNEAIVINFEKQKISEDSNGKAKRYLDKLIPFNRRLFLPDVQKLKDIEVKVRYENKKIFNNPPSQFNESVIKFVYENTLLFLTKNILNRNYILPETIRETQNFINVFYQECEENVDESLKIIDFINVKNFILEDIFRHDVQMEFFKELEEVSDDLLIFKSIRRLYQIFHDKGKKETMYPPYRRRGFSSENKNVLDIYTSTMPDVISLGDLYYVTQYLESILNIDDLELIKLLDYFKIYFSVRLRIMQSEENKHTVNKMSKYGFVNSYYKILASEKKSNKRRDFVLFHDRITSYNSRLETNIDKFILSQFILYLGIGYTDYRNDREKEILIENTSQGVFSPFAIFHNYYNLNILSKEKMLGFSTDDAFVKVYSEWYKKSIFISQLYDISFTLKLYESISNFKVEKIKEKIPDTYFENICLQFIYGIIYSLDVMENSKLVEDFTNNPIILVLLKKFIRGDYKLTVLEELNIKYDIQQKINNEYEITDKLITVINTIFDESTPIDEVNSPLSIDIKKVIDKIYIKIKNKPTFRSQTYAKLLQELEEVSGSEELVNNIRSFQSKVNSKNDKEQIDGIKELKEYLKSL
ncbi:hypothetical protein ADIWIN_2448 [Winogradskyella psychrotolerans RS-3]|uniref:KAP NTPase domain-containing protein n=1 Tax=Winogradskyella psychrotolerans RS-3 TaxID=641526 RepID=S7X942_9FLAO|nr:hypothetical protein [Winogradskyella psychrotolerans]EPR72558.1 hypothetical protein ADIWIN_2448 [Winogradskyella psychrotolerans RS-3]